MSFIGPFTVTFLIAEFVLVIQFLWVYIDELVGKGLSLGIIFEFMGWGAAIVLPQALPLATLLASIMALGNLGENNELLAMKAAGISLPRILYPQIYVAIIISIGAFFISNNLIPVAYNNIYTLQYDIKRTKEEIKIPTGTFYNGIDGYTLRISSRNKESEMMYDVMVYNHTENKGNVSLAVADSGVLKFTPDKNSLIFTLYNGVSYEENNTRKYMDTTYVLQKSNFSKQEIVIPLENYNFKKSDENMYGNEIMSRNLAQLQNDKDSIGGIYNGVYTEQRARMNYSASLLKSDQLDTAMNKGYTKALDTKALTDSLSIEEERAAVQYALSNIEAPISTLNTFDRESNQYTFSLRRIILESYRKFTLSFACLIFFFIGAPLGAIIRKGGFGTPVIISALLFVLYWVIDISGKKLARDGVITPAMGAFISSLIMLPLGVFLTWKATKDSSLFSLDALLNKVKLFFKKFSLSNVRTKKQ